MQHYKMDKFPSRYIPHRLAYSHRIHIKSVYPPSDLKDKGKMYVSLKYCDTDNRHSIFYNHSTVVLRYLCHYDNEHICFHHPLVSPELEPLFHPYLGTNGDACSIFFVKVNETFFQSTDHIPSLYWLWHFNR